MPNSSGITGTGRERALLAAIFAVFALCALLGVACQSTTSHDAVAVTRSACSTCHMTEFERATNPVHVGNFPQACGQCHAETGWSPAASFDHAKFFALEGAHSKVKCSQCHVKGFNAGDTPKDCVGCHRKDYDASPFPGHQTFSTQCLDCHNVMAWKPASISDHDRFFKLDGKHTTVACASCHTQGYAAGQTPKDCVGCHRKDYDTSPFPNHTTFATTCADCHATTGWKPATLPNHDQFFKLDGKHTTVACASCHTKGYAAGQTPKDCVGCHRKDYDTSPFPNHTTFATTCADCHATTGWKPATLPNHDQFFKLDGKHTTVACASCHTKGYAAGQTPKDCVGCHRKDYDTSPFPNHTTFATTCADCHATTGWKPATLPNHDQFFKLDGAHTTAPCASCHTQGYAAGQTPKDCVGCHRKNYDASPYPGHSAFPTTCMSCHSTTAWKPASGGHPETAFPIKTGAHKVVICVDCHNASLGATNSKNNADCVGCHTGTHTRATMDAKHSGVNNYPTGAAAANFCLMCHADGRNRF